MSRLGRAINKYPVRFFIFGAVVAPMVGGILFGGLGYLIQSEGPTTDSIAFFRMLSNVLFGLLFFGIFGFLFGVTPALISTAILFLLRRKNLSIVKAIPIVFGVTFIAAALAFFPGSFNEVTSPESTTAYDHLRVAGLLGAIACTTTLLIWGTWIAIGWAEPNE